MMRQSIILPLLAIVVAAAGVAASAAPAAADEITVRRYSRSYLRGEFLYASRTRRLPAVLLGNPFAVSDQALRDTLLPVLRNPMRRGRLAFTAAVGDRSGYFVVLAFDPPSGVALDGVCADPVGLGSDPRSGALRLLALLCRGKTSLAQIQGTMPPPAAPDDPAFIALARQMLRDLAPRWAITQPAIGRRGD
jgi:hypothetical protein